MSAWLTLQYLLIALAALLSLWVVMKTQFPNAARRLRTALALPLVREGRPAWLRALGLRIAPPAGRAGDGTCGGCDSCGPSSHETRK